MNGYRHSKAWATDQRLFFSLNTSHPFTMFYNRPKKGMAGQKIALKFINPNNEPVKLKVGISAVDIEGAEKNLEGKLETNF